MLFNSYEFLLVFLPCVLAGYFLIARLSSFAANAFERTRGHANVEILDFHAEPLIVMDLDHFTDIYHYSPKLSRALVEAIAAGRYKLTRQMLDGNNAWLRKAARETSAAAVIAEARARPMPETPDGKAFVPSGGFAPPKVN